VRLPEVYAQMKAEAGKVVVGQDEVFEQVVVAFLAGGHVLLEGVPGVAKTLTARTHCAAALGLGFARIQFTADLMPSDVVGTSVFRHQRRGVLSGGRARSSPSIVVADEINRAPPKTQSALLEAMEERQVTIEGKSATRCPSPSWCWRRRTRIELRRHLPAP
jgi:MoxR-like ATPase